MMQGRVIASVVILVVVVAIEVVVVIPVVVANVEVDVTVTVGENVVVLTYEAFNTVTTTVGD